MTRKPRSAPPREVFLSHASKDRRTASRIAAILRGHGIPVWFSETDLLGAQQWHDEIGAALARCDWFLLLLSPHAARSRWVKRELHYALRVPRYGDRIVPVHFRTCDTSLLSWTLDDFQWVDFSGEFSVGCRALLRTWGIGLRDFSAAQQPAKTVRKSRPS